MSLESIIMDLQSARLRIIDLEGQIEELVALLGRTTNHLDRVATNASLDPEDSCYPAISDAKDWLAKHKERKEIDYE